MQTRGPEARPWRVKSIGWDRLFSADPQGFPQIEAGPMGAQPGAPTRKNMATEKRMAGPPVP